MRGRVLRAGATAALALALAGLPAVAHAEDDVSWSDVQRARKDVRLNAVEVARIRLVLTRVRDAAAEAQASSVAADAVSDRASRSLADAERTVDGLQQQAGRAERAARAVGRRAGSVTMQLSRAGDPALSVWLSGGRSPRLLYRLGALERLSRSSSAMLDDAVADARQARSVRAQESAAARVRDRLAARARALAEQADRARREADRRVAATEQRGAVLTAQLRALGSASQRVAADYDQQQTAKAAAARAGTGSADTLLGRDGTESVPDGSARAIANDRLAAFGWDAKQGTCLGWLWTRESGWRWNAYNASSGAYGIPQSLPAGKMASAGADWRTSAATQIEWGLGYIRSRYGSPCNAWAHETSIGWY